jgi:hypothetical protein
VFITIVYNMEIRVYNQCGCEGGSLSTTSNVDVQGLSPFTACCMDGRVYPNYTISSVDVQGVSLFTVSKKNLQGVFF